MGIPIGYLQKSSTLNHVHGIFHPIFHPISWEFHRFSMGKSMGFKAAEIGCLGLHCAQDLQLGAAPGSDLKIAGISKGFPMIHCPLVN
jgi:hypothetical protein